MIWKKARKLKYLLRSCFKAVSLLLITLLALQLPGYSFASVINDGVVGKFNSTETSETTESSSSEERSAFSTSGGLENKGGSPSGVETQNDGEEADIRIVKSKEAYTIDEKPEFTVKRKLPFFRKAGMIIANKFANKSYEDLNSDLSFSISSKNLEMTGDFEVRAISSDTLKILPKEGVEPSPGRYTLKLHDDGGEIEQEFVWGVLAVNTNKETYGVGEKVEIYMAVLDENGHMACGAPVEVKVVGTDGITETMSADGGGVKVGSSCGFYGYTEEPDFFAEYTPWTEGAYDLTVATLLDGEEYSEQVSFAVTGEENEFVVERISPTRIYPPLDYPVEIKVKPAEDFKGTVTERVPTGFEIKSVSGYSVSENLGRKVLSWEVDWEGGKEYSLNYSYNAPDISPKLYLLGSLEFTDDRGNTVYSEVRQWQVASDAYDDVFASPNPVPTFRWQLDGDTTEDMQGLDGTSGTPTFVSGIIPNDIGQAGDFTGAVKVNIPSDPQINNGSGYSFTKRTISVWINADDFTGDRILWDQGGTSHWFGLYANGGDLYGIIGEGGSQRGYVHTTLSTGTTYHIGFVVDMSLGSNGLKLYINGQLVDQVDQTAGTDLSSHSGGVGLGGANSNIRNHNNTSISGYWDGRIQDMVYYSETALTGTEIQNIYNAGAAAGTNQLHYRWRNDESDVNTDPTSGSDWLENEDTALSSADKNETYRLRIESANSDTSVESAARTYELQWGDKSSVVSCSDISTWTGVADSSDEFDMSDTVYISNGETVDTGFLVNSEGYTRVDGEGLDTSDTSGSIGPLDPDEYTELEYSITPTDEAITGRTYCFRLYDTSSGGQELDTYVAFPELVVSSTTVSLVAAIGEAGTFSSQADGGWSTISFNNTYSTTPVVVGVTNSRTGNNAMVFESRNIATDQAEMRVCESDGQTASGCATHASETVGYMVIDPDLSLDVSGIEAGTFDIAGGIDTGGDEQGVQTVSYDESFGTAPYVFASVQTVNGTAPVEARVTVTAADSFKAGICEQNAQDDCNDSHTTETVGWVAIEPGNIPFDELADAGSVSHGGGETWTSTGTFGVSFGTAPVIIAKLNGVSGNQRLEISEADAVTTTSANVRFCELDGPNTCDSHNSNPVSWLAVEAGDLTVTGIDVAIDQDTYRFYEDNDAIQPTVALAAENTAITDIADTDVFRIRTALQVGLNNLAVTSKTFKLQYGQGSDCTQIGTWNDVGAIGSGTIWRGYNGTPADGANLTTSLLNSQNNILETYEEQNNSSSNPNSINTGSRGEWDWVVQNNGATSSTDYCFRMVTSADSVLQYTNYPKVTTVAAGITISGTAYTDDDEVTTIGGEDICVAVNGTQDPGDCDTTSSGVFSLTGIDATSGGEQITLFIDGGTRGNLVTTGDGNDITGLKLYQDHISVRYEQGSNMTILDMDAYDDDQNSTDMLFDADDLATDRLAWETATELYIVSGYTFAPGGDTNGHDIEIDGTWTAASGETIKTDGTFKLDSGGTFNSSTSALTFDSASGSEDLITAGTGSIYDLIIDDGGGSLTVDVQDPLVVANDLTITDGTLDVVNGENNSITVGGSWSNSDTFEARNGTVTFDSGTAETIDSGCSDTSNCPSQDFYDLGIDKDSSGDTVSVSGSDLLVSNTLTVTTGIFIQGTQSVRTAGSTAISVGGSGTWQNHSTGDIEIGGTVSNSGLMSLRSAGSCGSTDDISITSVSGTPSWSGGGTYTLEDVSIADQNAAVAIDVFSGTDAGGNAGSWSFYPGCDTGNLTTDIVDSGGSPVSSPSVPMGNVGFSFIYQTANGTLGISSEKIRVYNTTANSQWTLSLAADGGAADNWDEGAEMYDYNDPTASANDGSDGDALGGQMTVGPASGIITPQGGCSNTGLSLGSQASYNEEISLNSITVLTAGGSAEVGCYWDTTGIPLDQSIPEEQASSSYTIDMTLSIIAN